MNKIPFDKQPLTYQQQLNQLENRGLFINDKQKVIHLLETISYYRLSGYFYPFLEDKQNHIFKKGAKFDDAFKLYCFDRELRKLVLSEIEKIEIAVRAKMIYVLSHKHGAFWLSNNLLFKNPKKYKDSVEKIIKEYHRSDEEFIKFFKNKYSDKLPPAWISIEITSFGILSMLYNNLSQVKEKRAIANHFGLSDSVFQTWLHSLVYLRNICAHHSRLWNRNMNIQPNFPKKTIKTWIDTTNIKNNKAYFMLAIIQYFLQSVNKKSTFSFKLNTLLDKYKNVDITAMNFPKNWKKEKLWNNQ